MLGFASLEDAVTANAALEWSERELTTGRCKAARPWNAGHR